MKPSLLIGILTGFASFLLALFGLSTFGSFFPAIPLLGELGPVLTAMCGRLSVGEGSTGASALLVGAAMCPTCACGTYCRWP